ncbi:uncharacterized protein LOC110117729 [Ceratitis capitata]|uniref:uncharacterized protein LOC110117729 n=1 Tax=Ceratitis capitata TaxID=7213 RepID=UPI000C6C42F9|nr:uncharacterized protein LOC110117729 [Ceratitis capitata]
MIINSDNLSAMNLVQNPVCYADGSITRVCCIGYTGDGYNCISDCPNGCPNGSCVAPNLCRCDKGFTKYRGPYSACEPIPTTPETSTLETTFETTPMTTSMPNCFDFCYNGTCVNNLCNSTCLEGFEQQADNHFVCKSKLVVSGSSTTWTHYNLIPYFVSSIYSYIFAKELFIFL